jgi:hypothetical protein
MLRPRQRQPFEPVRQSPGGPITSEPDEPDRLLAVPSSGDTMFSAEDAAGALGDDPRTHNTSALEDDDVRADATVPTDT